MIADHQDPIPVAHLDPHTSRWLLSAVFPANRHRLAVLLASHGVYLSDECDHDDDDDDVEEEDHDYDDGDVEDDDECDHNDDNENDNENEHDGLEDREDFQDPESLDLEWCMMKIQELHPDLRVLLARMSCRLRLDCILYGAWFVNPFRVCNSLKMQLENGEFGDFEHEFERIEELVRLLDEFVARMTIEEKESVQLIVFCKHLYYFFKLLHSLQRTLCDGFGYVDNGHGCLPVAHEDPLR